MNINIVNEFADGDIDQLVDLYSNEFWCKERTKLDVSRMLSNTDIDIGIKDENNDLIGFARVLTDYVFKATVYDVIVHESYRGKGIGKIIMNTIMNHDRLKGVEHFDLNCLPEMFSFYKQWGFTEEVGELGFMRKFNS